MEILFVYVTMPNIHEARNISEKVLEQELAAGVNIFPQIESIFFWKDELKRSNEAVCIFKTSTQNFQRLEELIIELHSYETPCIAAITLDKVNKDFANWVKSACI